jgi:hypothetical protein
LINNYDPKQGLCEKCICKCLGRRGSWFAAGDLCTTVPPQPRANPLSPPASHASPPPSFSGDAAARGSDGRRRVEDVRRAVARDSEGVILAKQLDATQRGDSGRRRCWLAFLRLRGSSSTAERVVGGKWPSEVFTTSGRTVSFGSRAASAKRRKFCNGDLTRTLILLKLCEFCCAGTT